MLASEGAAISDSVTMNEKDTKNALDTAVPKPEASSRLNEAEKKAVELGGRIEHAQGDEKEKLHDQARELDAEANE